MSTTKPPPNVTPQDPREVTLRVGIQTVLHGLFVLHGLPGVQVAFEATLHALASLEDAKLPPHAVGLRDAARAAAAAYGAAMGAGIIVADASARVNGKPVLP